MNLSDAFTFQEKDHQNAETDAEKDPLDSSPASAPNTGSAEPELTTSSSQPAEEADVTTQAEPNLGEVQPEAAEHTGSA